VNMQLLRIHLPLSVALTSFPLWAQNSQDQRREHHVEVDKSESRVGKQRLGGYNETACGTNDLPGDPG
jgi:hypothetical protein